MRPPPRDDGKHSRGNRIIDARPTEDARATDHPPLRRGLAVRGGVHGCDGRVLLACASLTGLSGGAAGEERDGGVDGAVDAKQEMGFDADLDADLDVKLGDGNLLDDAEYDAADAMVPATGAVQVSSGSSCRYGAP